MPQLDSALATCRRTEAEDMIVLARSMFFACQADGRSLEKFLKSFKELLEFKKENQLSEFVKLLAASKPGAMSK